MNFRVADYLLRQHNIRIPQTPARLEDCPNWMRMGFILFRRLENMGYRLFPESGAERLHLEVYPHASYTVLLEGLPFPKHNLEGRLQRQLVLHEQGVNVPDPMRFFEEITRHRLLNGILPLDDLYTPGELDALVAAYTAWLAASRPEVVTQLGDAEEGQIVLPVAELKTNYN
jgi:predicted RNase H-like nuclease